MSAKQRKQDDLLFIETCRELQLMQDTDAEFLQQLMAEDKIPLAQQAVKRGILTPTDVDIVHSLQFPTEVVPGYEILGLIGRGGMGVVYRARQIDLDRVVALKTILVSNVSNPTVAARFEREAKALARLQHPNIVQALNFGKHEGRYFFAMEYVPGRTCEQWIRDEGLMKPQQVWFYARQVASGLIHALRQNLIHRDIKPANLILTAAPEGSVWLQSAGPQNTAPQNTGPPITEIVKITDFGLAILADTSDEQMRLTTGDKILGSPAYMSPEQFTGETVDFRSDLYSLGATAWHLLFGKPPFQGGNVASLYQQKCKPLAVDRAELPITIPEDQWSLLCGLLDPNPENRPPSYESFIDAIDGFVLDRTAVTIPGAGGVASPTPLAISEQPTAEVARPPRSQPPGAEVDGAPTDGRVDLAPTIESPRVDEPFWSALLHRWRKPLGITMALLSVVVVAGMLVNPLGAPRGPRTHTRVVDAKVLFDGETLSGWDVGGSMVGAWNTLDAPDFSTAIGCISDQGALTRSLPPVDYPRIGLFVWVRQEAGPVDIDFAVDRPLEGDRRGCVRIHGRRLTLGCKDTDFGALLPAVEISLPASLHDRYHVLHLERQPQDWFVFWEQEFVGSLPISRIGEGDALRLVIHESESTELEPPAAYFSDVRVDHLAANSEAD